MNTKTRTVAHTVVLSAGHEVITLANFTSVVCEFLQVGPGLVEPECCSSHRCRRVNNLALASLFMFLAARQVGRALSTIFYCKTLHARAHTGLQKE